MELIKHAEREFEFLEWPGDNEMQKMVCNNVLELLRVFSQQGHSGSSAPYVLDLFKQLASFNPIGPLTGKDKEWCDVGEQNGVVLYQNRRDGEVFKNNDGAYWISGKIFKDKDGCTFTNIDSRVPVTFPWNKPKPQIVEIKE